MSTPEEIKAEYTSSLTDLTFNSKPLINVLTMLADENSPNAKVIVEAIETHLSKVPIDVKLPILYLIDCIVKCVGGTYTTLFSQNIVSIFCSVFTAVDEKTRAEMFKLRQTWNEVFPQKKLYAIDVQIKLLDPAWPVTAQPSSNSIYFNPKFLQTNPDTQSNQIISATNTANVDKETLLMQEKLIQKQKVLLELQQKKLELEVLQTQVKLQEQIKNNVPVVPVTGRPQNILLKPEVAKQLVPNLSRKSSTSVASSIPKPQPAANNGMRINPVKSDLIAAVAASNNKPAIRDPRLLRQQQKPIASAVNLKQPTQQSGVFTDKTQAAERKTRSDPRLITKTDSKPRSNAKRSSGSDSNSLKSSSGSSLESPTKSSNSSPPKHKKKKTIEEKRVNSKNQKLENEGGFKSVKSSMKNRNYVRRVASSASPEPRHDEDLRSFGPPEKQSRSQAEVVEEKPTGMDVDLRQLPVPITAKKRPSTESPNHGNAKKSKSEILDKLFGDEDTDLRQLPLKQAQAATEIRPPTPPPPIISSNDSPKERAMEKSSPQRSNLDAVRAKLANATNRDKVMAKSFNKKKLKLVEDQDLRFSKPSSSVISPAKDEDSFNVSLQPISDEDLIDSDEDKKQQDPVMVVVEEQEGGVREESLIPFKDKDERLNVVSTAPPLQQPPPPPFFARFPGWRGGRRPRMPWGTHPQTWRNFHDASTPPLQHSPIDQLPDGAVNDDEIKSIAIDGVQKDIRFYGETGIVFIDWDDPRDLTFQDDGVRRVTFNEHESYVLGFNQPYQEVQVNGATHRVRIGAPSREIFIDGTPYECFFGSAGIQIDLDGAATIVQLEGPPPPVKIGESKRIDVVAGKIKLFIDAKLVMPVFLDARLQKFIVDGQSNTLKFVNALESVLINDVLLNVEYGGLPKPIVIRGKKHYVRFSVLPKDVQPGRIRIKGMEGEVCGGGDASPKPTNDNSTDSTSDPYDPALPIVGANVQTSRDVDSPDRNSNSPNIFQNIIQTNNLDVLSNAMATVGPTMPTTGSYQVGNQSTVSGVSSNQHPGQPSVPAININDLFQKLVSSGFVTSSEVKTPAVPVKQVVSKQPSIETLTKQDPSMAPGQNVTLRMKKSMDNLRLASFKKPEQFRLRQKNLYDILYMGMQCSSCGMRFPMDASTQYSQHLDWHFRQNRKGKKNSRVATSRRWYYSLSDWKNYEEVEDLEEREKNFFDQQQAEGVAEEEEQEVEEPSVAADPYSTTESCAVCHDKFDQFFNEEKEEWHLRNAVRVDEKTYHPICYEDYQQSFVDQSMDESKIEPVDEKLEDRMIPGLEIVIDDDDDEEMPNDDKDMPDVLSLENDAPVPEEKQQQIEEKEDDDDDVILNEVAPIKIVVDDDDEEILSEDVSSDPETVKVKRESLDDGFIEVSSLISLQNGKHIKIKSEPVDLDDEQLIPSPTKESQPPTLDLSSADEEINRSPHVDQVSSIDGNLELVSNTSVAVPVSITVGNRIKINISKPIAVINKEKEVAAETSNVAVVSETYVDALEPFPPGEEPTPAALKPALQGVKLRKLPPVSKGKDLTGLCSIM